LTEHSVRMDRNGATQKMRAGMVEKGERIKEQCTREESKEQQNGNLFVRRCASYERLSTLTQQLLLGNSTSYDRGFTRPCDGHVYCPPWITNGFSERQKTCSAAETRAALVLGHSVSRPTNSAHSKVTYQLPSGYLGPSG
jgi:hypothetical protein